MMELARRALRDWAGLPAATGTAREHLDAALAWLCRAQDAGGGGVARSYSLRWQRAFRKKGWLPPYPETTGYIIPTFYDYAKLTGRDEFRARAACMAQWESDVQMESGAVMGGVVTEPPAPAIFNTGQALFGWARAHEETGSAVFRSSAARAADFMLAAQDADGAWRRFGSRQARGGVNVYDARSAWGLARVGQALGVERYREAARKNLDFALTRQRANGWIDECSLDDDRRPLVHTLAYTVEGWLEGGILLGEPRFVEAARRTADALLGRLRADGGIAGRFDAGWNPAVDWDCLTGNAQCALCWWRLFEIGGEERYRQAARAADRFLMRTQSVTDPSPGVRGGIKGSHPIWGGYLRHEYLNWAAKFFADALLLELRLDAGGAGPA